MDWGSLIGAGISLYSASKSKDAAQDAAVAQVASSQDNIDFSKWLYEQQSELQKPYYNTGVAVLPMLQARAGVIPTTGTKPQLQKIPRYDANQAAGIDNIYDYVSNLYIDGLGREGTQENIEKWTEKIASGQLNKKTVIDEFMKEADANNIQYDRNALTNIQKAININSSPMATTNYLTPYLAGGDGEGSGNYGSSSGSDGAFGSPSTMNPSSALGSFSFSGISNVLGKYGYSVAKAIGSISPIAGLTIAGITALSDYMGEAELNNNINTLNEQPSTLGAFNLATSENTSSGDGSFGSSNDFGGADSFGGFGSGTEGGYGGFGSASDASEGGYSGGW